jgi:hypothetical protein
MKITRRLHHANSFTPRARVWLLKRISVLLLLVLLLVLLIETALHGTDDHEHGTFPPATIKLPKSSAFWPLFS